MLKQKRMLKLYIGILVFGVVFSFRNVNKIGFSQNIAKAMEYDESSKNSSKIDVNDFFDVNLVEPNKFFTDLDEEDLVYKESLKILVEFDSEFFESFCNNASTIYRTYFNKLSEIKKKYGTLGVINEEYYPAYFGVDSTWSRNSSYFETMRNLSDLSKSLVFKVHMLRQFIEDARSSFKINDGRYSGEIGRFLTAYSKKYNNARQFLKKSPKELSEDEVAKCFDIFRKSRVLLKILNEYIAGFKDFKECVAKAYDEVDFLSYYEVLENFVDAWDRTIKKIEIAVCGKFSDVIADYVEKNISYSDEAFWANLVGFKDLNGVMLTLSSIFCEFPNYFKEDK